MEIWNAPARYIPFATGKYEVKMGLQPLSKNLGNGPIDQQAFQFDREFPEYRANKIAARRDDLAKYVVRQGFSLEAEQAVADWMVARLAHESPHGFSISDGSLECALTGERIPLDTDAYPDAATGYRSILDALAMQVCEDVAVVHATETANALVAAHVMAPSHWDPREKIGRDFAAIHTPVAGMDALRAKGVSISHAMVQGAVYQRLGWSIQSGLHLNHHPVPPHGWSGSIAEWDGKDFEVGRTPLVVRVERQVLAGLPEHGLFLFLIRVYRYPVDALDAATKRALRSALESMSQAQRAYKGIDGCFDDVLGYLG